MQQFRPIAASLFLLLSLLVSPLSACAASKKAPPAITRAQGGLPSSGSVVIRSGLAGMDERAPLFLTLRRNLVPLLEQRGLAVVESQSSTLEAMPHNGMSSAVPYAEPGSPGKPDTAAGDEEKAKARAAELVKAGSMPKAKMERYKTPARDADLPASVLSVAPKDPYAALFALSQREGTPLMRRGGRIPGRLPREILTTDPSIADYAIIARFSVVRPMAARSSGIPLAAGNVSGVPGLGYGSPGSATWGAPSAPSYGSSPGDYARGYEAGTPRDTWNRQYDFMARDYTWRNSPPPPTGKAPADGYGAAYPPPGGRAAGEPHGKPPMVFRVLPGSGSMGFALELECYSLAPVKDGKAPVRLWKSTVHQRADSPDLAEALPDMARRALEK